MFRPGRSLECKIIGCNILLERAVRQLQEIRPQWTQVDMLQFSNPFIGVAIGFTLQLRLEMPRSHFSWLVRRPKIIPTGSQCQSVDWKTRWLTSINCVSFNIVFNLKKKKIYFMNFSEYRNKPLREPRPYSAVQRREGRNVENKNALKAYFLPSVLQKPWNTTTAAKTTVTGTQNQFMRCDEMCWLKPQTRENQTAGNDGCSIKPNRQQKTQRSGSGKFSRQD